MGHPLRLRDLTAGTRHTLLLYADASADPAAVAAVPGLCADVRARTRGEVDAYLLLSPDAGAPGPSAPPVVVDAGDEFRTRYGVTGTALYLIRPDGHLGFRSQPIDADALRKNLHLVFGGAR